MIYLPPVLTNIFNHLSDYINYFDQVSPEHLTEDLLSSTFDFMRFEIMNSKYELGVAFHINNFNSFIDTYLLLHLVKSFYNN